MIRVQIYPADPSETLPAGDRQVFDKDEVTVGRSATNDLALSSGDISSRHAKLNYATEGMYAGITVTDLGSSNGTYVDNIRIPPKTPIRLQEGQRVLFAQSYLVQVYSTEADSAPPPRTMTAVASRKNEEVDPPLGDKEKIYEQEIRIKRLIHENLIERLDLRRKDIASLSETDLRSRAEKTVEQILIDLRWQIPPNMEREKLIKEVLDEALGLGPLEALLADETVSEIMVNSYRQIYAERKGKLGLTDYRFSSEQAVLGAIERIIAPIGRRIDESSPIVDARLKDGSRVNAVIRPLALQGPCITIRKFSKTPLTADDLVSYGSMSRGMADFLKLAVEHRLNVVISGGTGSGKTTLLNVISAFIPEGRIITVEDAAELKLPQDHLVAFETRPPNLEGKGAITIRDLVRNALRMRPDRIIVGECRGGESLDMLQAMNTGHDGSMTTGHANAPADMMRRLETMVLMAGMDLPVRAIREQIASAVHLVVQQTRFSCGTRKVTAITEVMGMDPDEGVIMLQDIFLFKQDGYDENGKIHGTFQATGYIPKFFRQLQQRGLPVDASVFSPG